MRILIYSEGATGKPDEGIRKFCQGLVEGLQKTGAEVLLLSGPETRGRQSLWSRLEVNLHSLAPSLGGKIRRFHPDLLLYIPTASLTLPSFIRGILLAKWGKEVPFGWVGLQRGSTPHWSCEFPFPYGSYLLFISSEGIAPKGWRENGIRKIAGGVDLERFKPATPVERERIRRKYGINLDSFILLHVGHLVRNRNLNLLERIQQFGKDQVLLIGSSSTERDGGVIQKLETSGISVFTSYIENIEEVYRLSDCYLFPVTSPSASIEIPLSVLEAMATNLPVVTTKFGGLPDLFIERDGFFYAEEEEQFLIKIEEAKKHSTIKTRKMVLPYTWENVAKRILDAIQ
ncbi:glycosyltransferase family 4 protein [candidate division TA06 bacterium]|nr:glycosyltransferase family 4 protein [candidate division TA06 bacterium]